MLGGFICFGWLMSSRSSLFVRAFLLDLRGDVGSLLWGVGLYRGFRGSSRRSRGGGLTLRSGKVGSGGNIGCSLLGSLLLLLLRLLGLENSLVLLIRR